MVEVWVIVVVVVRVGMVMYIVFVRTLIGEGIVTAVCVTPMQEQALE